MIAQLQIRRDTKANWETVNPVLANGELGIEFIGNEARIKAGNGVKRWRDLQYISANVHGIDTINNSIAGIEIELNNLDNRIKNIDVAAIKGSVDKYAQLPPVSDVPEHSAYIVEEDENKGNASGIYMAVGGSWVFVAKFNIDLSNYYTKPEIDTKINNYYTKTETDSKDTAINTKFDDYYTKPETDNKMNEIEDSLEQRMKTIAIRGGVKTYAGLPDINNERTGDAYIVERDEHNYGISVIYAVAETSGIKQWVYVAQFIVDLTNYYNKEEIQEMFLDKYYTNDEIDNKLVIIEDKIVVLNNDLLNYYTKQVIDDKVNTVNTEIGTRVTNHNTDLSSHGIDVIKTDISELKTKVENIEAISIKGSVDTYASLPVITGLLTGTAYIVEKDENKNNITTIYAVEDNAGIKQWTFIGEFKVDLSNYYNKSEVDDKINSVSGGGGGSGINYSLTEQDTGRKWIDGKTIYQKTFNWTSQAIGAASANGWTHIGTVASIAPGATFIVESVTLSKDVNSGEYRHNVSFSIGMDGPNLIVWNELPRVYGATAHTITLWYTK